ncbi:MAG: family 2 glycosyl transferase [Candidatus Aramenus sulfurataquae]|jgi:cellulose synthase/poly-beta-1,6-N-acetylglucosamine synthase-like glycosyltransferase|uniref:Family 2 glycosyl transferase n=3 Tax=Candidatus Aramenus sulfurataquae TaxID=1326980 RepID=W7L707_9CREN|nr:MAG: family 2 glycosyl transferase [Candidatus Aramenus sulfurataquae]MCL7343181.1 glycosyltransferase [Candidatus Aramenus sulfurataquae]
MLDYLIVAVSLLVSAWSVYNSFFAFLGITWNTNENKVSSGPSFSIIIPAKNEEKVLGRLLDRLENQEYDRSKVEIIVVEDGSTDNTLGVCKNYEMTYDNVKCVHLEPSPVPNGKSRALNYALRIARGEIIGIYDADTVPRLDALSYAASKFLNDSNVGALQGRLVPINVRESVVARFASLEELFYEYSITGRARLNLFVPLEGTCTFIKRSVLEDVGLWNEYTLTEDLDLSLKITSRGYKIVYSPNVIAWREVPTSLKALIKQRLRWYRGHFEVSLKVDKIRLDPKLIDAMLIVASPIFMVLSLANYSLVILYPSQVYLFVTAIVSLASFTSLVLAIMISRKHLIEFAFPFLSIVYMNFVALLNLFAMFMEVSKFPKTWIKTERTGGITARIDDS